MRNVQLLWIYFFFNLRSKNLRLEKVSPRPPLFLSDPAPFSTLPRPLQLRRGSLHELQADQRRDGVPQHGEGAAGGKNNRTAELHRVTARFSAACENNSHSSCRFLQNSIFTAAAATALESICFLLPPQIHFFSFITRPSRPNKGVRCEEKRIERKSRNKKIKNKIDLI